MAVDLSSQSENEWKTVRYKTTLGNSRSVLAREEVVSLK